MHIELCLVHRNNHPVAVMLDRRTYFSERNFGDSTHTRARKLVGHTDAKGRCIYALITVLAKFALKKHTE